MERKVTFEDYGIEFRDSDFEGVSKETLEKCKTMVQETIEKFKGKEGE